MHTWTLTNNMFPIRNSLFIIIWDGTMTNYILVCCNGGQRSNALILKGISVTIGAEIVTNLNMAVNESADKMNCFAVKIG